jgi:CRP-like cAMP-binding protein
MSSAKHSPESLKEIARTLRRSGRRRAETHVAMPLPPERPKVARALEPVVRGSGPNKVVDALELTKVFNLEDLNAKADEGGAEPLSPAAKEHAKRLHSIPMMGSLSKPAFAELAAAVHRRALGKGEILFYEGQPARSFFIVAEGELEVVRSRARRRSTVIRVGPNEVLGVFGLFSGRRRAATLRSVGPSVVLEVPGTALARLVQRHASARVAVKKFYEERLLTVFLAGSPIFGELTEQARGSIVARFESKDVEAKSLLLAPGEVTNGLCLLMNGQIALRRHRKGETKGIELLRLARGQFFGVISAMVGTPSAISASALTRCSLTTLSHRQFSAMLAEHPELQNLPARLRSESLLVSKEIFVGDTGVPGLGTS